MEMYVRFGGLLPKLKEAHAALKLSKIGNFIQVYSILLTWTISSLIVNNACSFNDAIGDVKASAAAIRAELMLCYFFISCGFLPKECNPYFLHVVYWAYYLIIKRSNARLVQSEFKARIRQSLMVLILSRKLVNHKRITYNTQPCNRNLRQ